VVTPFFADFHARVGEVELSPGSLDCFEIRCRIHLGLAAVLIGPGGTNGATTAATGRSTGRTSPSGISDRQAIAKLAELDPDEAPIGG
jgi:hypothetical protein